MAKRKARRHYRFKTGRSVIFKDEMGFTRPGRIERCSPRACEIRSYPRFKIKYRKTGLIPLGRIFVKKRVTQLQPI